MRRTLIGLLAGLVMLGGSSRLVRGDDAEVESALKRARGRYAELVRLRELYIIKTNLTAQREQRHAERVKLYAELRLAEVRMEQYPARRNNIQEAEYQELRQFTVAARTTLPQLDLEVQELQTRLRQFDEANLANAATTGKPPRPEDRFNLLIAYPQAERDCVESFKELKTAVTAASSATRTVGQVLKDANDALNKAGEGDAQFGPSKGFAEDFKQFCRVGSVATSRPKPTPTKGKRPRAATGTSAKVVAKTG